MNITEKDVQLLELAYYFINNCHYKFVSSRSAQNEIWLGNPQHPQYPVIRLSQTRLSTVFSTSSAFCKSIRRSAICFGAIAICWIFI